MLYHHNCERIVHPPGYTMWHFGNVHYPQQLGLLPMLQSSLSFRHSVSLKFHWDKTTIMRSVLRVAAQSLVGENVLPSSLAFARARTGVLFVADDTAVQYLRIPNFSGYVQTPICSTMFPPALG